MLTAVKKGATQIATITYLSDGTKVKVQATGGAGLLYRGRFIYRSVLDGLPTIESKNTKLRQQVNIPKGYTPEQVSKAVFEHNNSF